MIWFEDPITFLKQEQNWYRILPSSDLSLEEQMNAVFMFLVYFTIGILIIKQDIRVIYLFVFVSAMTYLFYSHKTRENFNLNKLEDKINVEKQKYRDTYCLKPTKDNPFMNVTMKDIREFPNRPKACNISKPKIREKAEKYFNEGLVRTEWDVFNKNASDRQFFTNPNTTIPNDLDEYKQFLYHIPPTLKQLGQNF